MGSAKQSARSQTNRRRFYLARGEYEWPGSTDLVHPCPAGTRRVKDPIESPRLSVTTGRILTLRAASDLEPKLLEKLSEILTTLVRSGWDETQDGILNYDALHREPRLRKLRAELEEWAKQFHLTDSWCLQIALSSLRTMRYHGQLEWFDSQTHFNRPDPLYVTFGAPFNLPPYDPTYQRRADRIRAK